MEYIKVTSVQHLKELSPEDGGTDFFIQLNFNLRSTKHIQWLEDEQKFYVFNLIDDTEQYLTPEELYTESNIGETIDKGAFWKDPD